MLTLAHDSTIPNPRRGWATLTSFAAQATAVAILFVIPLIHPGLVPHLDLTPRLIPIFLPHASAPTVRPPSAAHSVTPQIANVLTVPREIPATINTSADQKPGEPEAPCLQCVATPGQSTIPGGFDTLSITPAPPTPTLAPKPPRISVMMDGYLTKRIQPTYPQIAKQARIQGPVEIAALISKQGTIENLQVLSGHPMLVTAALDAVKQWRYRPYILNGDPIEVNTKITVTFVLGGN